MSVELLLDAGRPADAARLLGSLVATNPDDPQLWCLLSRAQLATGESQLALQSAAHAVQLLPDHEWPHRLRALAWMELGKPRNALRAAKLAENLDPNATAVLHVLAHSYLANRQQKEARLAAERLRVLAPEWSRTHELLGLVALHQRRWKEAEASCREALRLEPELWTVHNNLGVVLRSLGRGTEAVESFHAAARLDPGADLARRNLQASVSTYVGQSGLALAAYVVLLWGLMYLFQLQSRQSQVSPAAAMGLLLIPMGMIADAIRRRRRLRGLPAVVQRFHQDELRRASRRNAVEHLKSLATGFGLLTALSWTICLFYFGPAGVGLTSPWAILYLVSLILAGLALAEAVADYRKTRGKRP
jgi:Flp pilus assembly protein TadD